MMTTASKWIPEKGQRVALPMGLGIGRVYASDNYPAPNERTTWVTYTWHGETHGATPNGGEPVVEDVPDFEERKCAGCGVLIECAKAEPPGAKCYACRQA